MRTIETCNIHKTNAYFELSDGCTCRITFISDGKILIEFTGADYPIKVKEEWANAMAIRYKDEPNNQKTG